MGPLTDSTATHHTLRAEDILFRCDYIRTEWWAAGIHCPSSGRLRAQTGSPCSSRSTLFCSSKRARAKLLVHTMISNRSGTAAKVGTTRGPQTGLAYPNAGRLALIKLFENHLKAKFPNKVNISYDISELNQYLDGFQDVAALV